MNKKKIVLIVAAVLITTNLFTWYIRGFFIGGLVDARGASLDNIIKYNKVKEMIKDSFVGNVDDNALMEGSIRGLAEATNDPYTMYMDKKEFESLQTYTRANYGGVGVIVGIDPKDNLIVIYEVIENSPAERAQVHAGDKLIKVNDTDVTGDNFDNAVSMIKGEAGTSVKITVFRTETNSELVFELNRDIIELKSVKSKVLQDNTGYIRIIQFSEKTPQELNNVMLELQNKGVEKFVLDLRDNPGGVLDAAVNICGQLIPEKLVVYTIDKQGNREDFKSSGIGTDMKFVVLVNDSSASASEVLAGAVKDYGSAKIVGKTTYGKGVVQSVFELGDGSGIKITTSKYYTPKGVSIDKIGVKPDVEVEANVKDKVISKLSYEEDNQLQKAIEVLNK